MYTIYPILTNIIIREPPDKWSELYLYTHDDEVNYTPERCEVI